MKTSSEAVLAVPTLVVALEPTKPPATLDIINRGNIVYIYENSSAIVFDRYPDGFDCM